MYPGMGNEKKFVHEYQIKRPMARSYPTMSYAEEARLMKAWDEWGISYGQRKQWRKDIDYAISIALVEMDHDLHNNERRNK